MLNAIATSTVRRIRSSNNNDMPAFTYPAHMAALLRGYADLRHNSVVVPELIAAFTKQVSTATLCTQQVGDSWELAVSFVFTSEV